MTAVLLALGCAPPLAVQRPPPATPLWVSGDERSPPVTERAPARASLFGAPAAGHARPPLNDPTTFPVVAGSHLATLDSLRAADPGWMEVESKRETLVVDQRAVHLVALEAPGNEAVLLVLAEANQGFEVLGVLSVMHGGLGASLDVVERRIDDGRLLLLIRCTRRFRALRGEVGATSETSWIVLGVEGVNVFLPLPEVHGYDDVHLGGLPPDVLLRARCVHPRDVRVVRSFEPATRRFGLDRKRAKCTLDPTDEGP